MKKLQYVNTLMGTSSVPRFSRGNTLPITQLPFGMVAFCPQGEIVKGREEWFFDPSRPYLEGIRLTHQPSPWIGDFGTILITPQADVISDDYSSAWSGYDADTAELCPDHLRVDFLRSGCTLELCPTERAGAIRLTFKGSEQGYLSIFNVHGHSEYKFDKERKILFGTNDYVAKGEARNFKMYFAIRLSCEVDLEASRQTENAFHIALKDRVAEARISTSYISWEMALDTLDLECGDKSFDTLRDEAEGSWEEKLSRIEIEAESDSQKRIFYSCMYRTFLFPRKAYEVEKSGRCVHYSPKTGKAVEGVRFVQSGFWDTYRTSFPLFSLIARDEYEQMLEGFLNDFEECGYLPRWTLIGEVGCMPSTLIDAVFADAVCKGIGDKSLHERALKAMLHHSRVESEDKRYGRNGINAYQKYGYVPYTSERESVNLTLDFSYGDWCIAQIAKALGEEEIYKEYTKRSEGFRHLFDKETGFMRARDEGGSFRADFDPISWGLDYTEGGAWQSSFTTPHALDDMAELLGGREKFLEKIDELFAHPPTYRVGGYGQEIHEMTEMAVCDLGQCAISNQPSFSIPYLYAYFGQAEKSQRIIEKICKEYFTPDAYPGDEDNGSMSAWYIFATIGMYPICPGKDEYVQARPLCRSFKIRKEQA